MIPRQPHLCCILIAIIGLVFLMAGGAMAAESGDLFTQSSALAAEGSDGARVYRQWCSTCHGDRGQGLTEEWRATWPKDKQNCWQSKCHAINHPPEGFTFPKDVPAVIGDNTLTKFGSAQDLYAYIRATMPYWNPNMLSEDQYRAITIFIVEANYSERGLSPPASLGQDLASVRVHPAVEIETPVVTSTISPWMVLVAAPILVSMGIVLWMWRRFTSSRHLPMP